MIKREELLYSLDDLAARASWGLEGEENQTRPGSAAHPFSASRIETLVAGFSNQCHLDCPFCYEEHYGRARRGQDDLDMDKLIRLIRAHKAETGSALASFRIGNTGEPLIHKEFPRLIRETQDSVNRFSVITSLSVKNDHIVDFVADHPGINKVHLSCDAGDARMYERIRINGDFSQVWENVKKLKRAGKLFVLNAVVLRENMLSLMELPERMASWNLEELHLCYPLNTTRSLDRVGLGKLPLPEFREFFLKIRDRCEDLGILLRTDPWVYLPEMVGVIPEIDTPDLYEEYQITPCDRLWLLTLHPDGTFHHCSVQNTSGSWLPIEERPFNRCGSLLDLVNSNEALRFRELQLTGAFPLPCRKICRKISFECDARAASLLFGMKCGSEERDIPVSELVSRLDADDRKITVRAYSGNMQKLLHAFPELRRRVDYIVDRDENIDCGIPAVTPDAPVLRGARSILLLGSNRSSVFQSVADRAGRYDEIYKLVVVGNDPIDFRIRRLKQ